MGQIGPISNSLPAPIIGNRVLDLTDTRLRSRKMDALLGMTDVVWGRAGSRRQSCCCPIQWSFLLTTHRPHWAKSRRLLPTMWTQLKKRKTILILSLRKLLENVSKTIQQRWNVCSWTGSIKNWKRQVNFIRRHCQAGQFW